MRMEPPEDGGIGVYSPGPYLAGLHGVPPEELAANTLRRRLFETHDTLEQLARQVSAELRLKIRPVQVEIRRALVALLSEGSEQR